MCIRDSCYIINGDASGLTDEEIRMVDEAIRKNNIEIVSPRYNEDMCTEPYFSRYPFFGLPTEVEDCDICLLYTSRMFCTPICFNISIFG